jgi:hypothetical protein
VTKARDIADFKFENIVDTGTEGTKVASGTTAQRGSTTGQWRYNSTTGFFEGRNASGVFSSLEPTPTVTSADISEVDSQAGGNQTVVVTGTNFASGGTITFVGNAGANFDASTTTFNSATQVTAVAPKASFLNAQEPYKIRFTSASGKIGTSGSGIINVDSSPVWQTSAGSLGTIIDNATGTHFTASATDADSDTVTYAIQSGSIPAGTSLNTSTGAISGDPTDVTSDVTSNFTLRATANGKTADRSFSIITTKYIPTFYDQIVTTQSLDNSNRNLAILVDPYDTSSDSGSGNITNRSGHSQVGTSIALTGLTRGGTGAGKYWSVDSGSASYMSFGNTTNLTNASSDSWAYCGWWRPSWEVDDSSQTSKVIWVLNDGDWSPNSQIGFRFGQGNGFRVHSGGSTNLLNVGIPSATYTNNWVFLCVWHRISGGMYAGQAFATDTNLSDHITHTTYSSSTGSSSGHSMIIGARPDSLSEDTHDGTYIGAQAAWYASGGSNSFVSTSESWTEARTQFEAIFDATKGRYA